MKQQQQELRCINFFAISDETETYLSGGGKLLTHNDDFFVIREVEM